MSMTHDKPAGPARKRVAILQSNYIPWKGYFDMIAAVDEFILYDDVQFTKNDWRNRNKIKTRDGVQWLTVPVFHKLDDRIRDVRVSQTNWHDKHWKTIQQNYRKAAAFRETGEFFENLYARATSPFISEINHLFITEICRFLDIPAAITWSSDYAYDGDRSERVLSLCQAAGGTTYLSGPAAQAYLDVDLFKSAGVEVEWMDYSGYPVYPQLHGEFDHGVSIVDLLMNTGREATGLMKCTRPRGQDT
jgi:hypothetical protein